MIRIGLLIYPGCLPTGVLAGLDFFKVANLIASRDLFEVQIVGFDKKSVQCAHGSILSPAFEVNQFKPDILVVPGFWSTSQKHAQTIADKNEFLQKKLNVISNQCVIASYCTGVYFHAKTSRLNQKNATVTWWLMRLLLDQFKKTKWQVNKTLVVSKQDITACGANGFYSIYEHIIQKYASAENLRNVRKYLMVPTAFNANDPFVKFNFLISENKDFNKLKRRIEKTLSRDLSVETVAKQLNLTSKTLSRRLQSLSVTPAYLFRTIKYKQAADLILHTDLSIKEICDDLGFDDESNFRRGFKNLTQMTPSQYKRKYKV